MPQLQEIYPATTYSTETELRDLAVKARAYGFISLNQGKALVRELTPMLPVTVTLTQRTYKGALYVTANGQRFSITCRAAIQYKAWNPNPRKPAKNPWAD